MTETTGSIEWFDAKERDLAADLELCGGATASPWYIFADDFVFDAEDNLVAEITGMDESDTRFIIEAREGWPYAIERALAAEADLAAWNRALIVSSPLQRLAKENEGLRDDLAQSSRVLYEAQRRIDELEAENEMLRDMVDKLHGQLRKADENIDRVEFELAMTKGREELNGIVKRIKERELR